MNIKYVHYKCSFLMFIFYDHCKCPFCSERLLLSAVLYSICTWSFRMLNVEMPPDSSPKKTFMANRERLREERDKKAREAQHGSPPPRHSSR